MCASCVSHEADRSEASSTSGAVRSGAERQRGVAMIGQGGGSMHGSLVVTGVSLCRPRTTADGLWEGSARFPTPGWRDSFTHSLTHSLTHSEANRGSVGQQRGAATISRAIIRCRRGHAAAASLGRSTHRVSGRRTRGQPDRATSWSPPSVRGVPSHRRDGAQGAPASGGESTAAFAWHRSPASPPPGTPTRPSLHVKPAGPGNSGGHAPFNELSRHELVQDVGNEGRGRHAFCQRARSQGLQVRR